VIQGIVLLFSFLYVLVNLMVDVVYTLVDPRIRFELIDHPTAPVPPGLVIAPPLGDLLLPVKVRRGFVGFLRNHPTVAIGGACCFY